MRLRRRRAPLAPDTAYRGHDRGTGIYNKEEQHPHPHNGALASSTGIYHTHRHSSDRGPSRTYGAPGSLSSRPKLDSQHSRHLQAPLRHLRSLTQSRGVASLVTCHHDLQRRKKIMSTSVHDIPAHGIPARVKRRVIASGDFRPLEAREGSRGLQGERQRTRPDAPGAAVLRRGAPSCVDRAPS